MLESTFTLRVNLQLHFYKTIQQNDSKINIVTVRVSLNNNELKEPANL